MESRFQWKHTIDTYSAADLAEIFVRKVREINWELGVNNSVIEEVIEKNKEIFVSAGRDVINFISKCKIVHAKRVITLDKRHKFILTRDDLENGITVVKKHIKMDEDISPPPTNMYI